MAESSPTDDDNARRYHMEADDVTESSSLTSLSTMQPDDGIMTSGVMTSLPSMLRDDDVTTPDSAPSLSSMPDERKPAILQEANLMQLLADAITYRSPLKDIQVILKCGGKVNSPVKRGLRPLHYAVYVDYVECVQLLLQRGADVNAADDIGYTPIHLCARKGNIQSMKVLVDSGATVDFLSGDDNVGDNTRALGYLTVEPLNLAIENNHVDCVRLLLESGAKPDNKYFMGYEINLVPLEHLECLRILLTFGADPNVFNRCGMSPLMKACRQQNIQAARLLLSHGASVDLQCPPRFDQKTALLFAVATGNSALVHVLLRYGASTTRPEGYKFGALHCAVLADRPDICTLLLRYEARVDEQSDENTTPLMLACATRGLSRQQEIVELLLERGASVHANSGYVTFTSPAFLSPLVEYLRNMENDVDLKVLQLLVKYGALVHFKGAATNTRLIDPFGVLNYLGHVTNKAMDEVYYFLVANATRFDLYDIQACVNLSASRKSDLVRLTKTPRDLKHLVRFFLRTRLRLDLQVKVTELPVPVVVQNYILIG